jgi:hypothetical protein
MGKLSASVDQHRTLSFLRRVPHVREGNRVEGGRPDTEEWKVTEETAFLLPSTTVETAEKERLSAAAGAAVVPTTDGGSQALTAKGNDLPRATRSRRQLKHDTRPFTEPAKHDTRPLTEPMSPITRLRLRCLLTEWTELEEYTTRASSTDQTVIYLLRRH